MIEMENFEIGSLVKLKDSVTCNIVPEGRQDNKTSTIKLFLSDIEGGVRLEQDLNGMKYWNISDLELVK